MVIPPSTREPCNIIRGATCQDTNGPLHIQRSSDLERQTVDQIGRAEVHIPRGGGAAPRQAAAAAVIAIKVVTGGDGRGALEAIQFGLLLKVAAKEASEGSADWYGLQTRWHPTHLSLFASWKSFDEIAFALPNLV